jgi:protein-S-isoprenylcysteine O-methyltransferase Ste14
MTAYSSADVAARVLFWLGGSLFVMSLITCAWSYVFVFGRATHAVSWRALALDSALFTTFALHHSLFARGSAKRFFGSLSAQAFRSFYVYVASGLFIVVCLGWRPIGGEVYHVTGFAALALATVQVVGVLCIARAAARIDPLELAGIRPETPSGLQSDGVYGLVRHPIYLGWVLAVFATPHMTGDRLAFAVISTLYLVAAVPFEERSLRRSFGEAYARYARAVRWRIVPFIY